MDGFNEDEDDLESEANLNASAYYSDYVSAAQRKDSSLSLGVRHMSADNLLQGELEQLELLEEDNSEVDSNRGV